jgi:Transposase DDE domain
LGVCGCNGGVRSRQKPGGKVGRPKRGQPPKLSAITGKKHLQSLLKLRKKLRKAHAHPNRILYYDDVLTALLLAFFNPVMRSLRMIEDFSNCPLVQEELHVERICKSTLSDLQRIADPSLLEPLIQSLQAQIPHLQKTDGPLGTLLKKMRLVDGSFFKLAADVQWAFRKGKAWAQDHDDRFARLDLQLCALTGTPECLEINGKGTSEVGAARRHIEAGVLYVADRGIFSFAYIQDLVDARADFVLRIKTNHLFTARESRLLTDQDQAAGVLCDTVGVLTGQPPVHRAPQMPLREIVILDPKKPESVVRLLTNRMDVPAYLVGEVYRCRWQIELFFRWLKVHANFRHLISHSKNGITLGFYVAVIGTLLMYLHTGRKVSKYAFGLLTMVASGQATLAQILPILERRERTSDLARQRLARIKAAQKSVV